MIFYILSHPFFFNLIRSTVAGDQMQTKNFVKKNLIKYRTKTILDIGCGTGDFIEAMPRGISYLGIDINKNYIKYAKKRYGRKKSIFLLQDVTERKFYEKRKFDAVILISMLHHLSDQELEDLLPIVKRVTKKAVLIADIIPDPDGILKRLMVKLDQGKFVRSRREKLKILQKYFRIVKTEIIPSRLAVQFGIVCEV